MRTNPTSISYMKTGPVSQYRAGLLSIMSGGEMVKQTIAVLTLITLAGCSEGATDPDSSGLSRSEALAIAGQITDAGRSAPGAVPSTATAAGSVTAAGDPTTVRSENHSIHPCPISGQISLVFVATAFVDTGALTLGIAGDLTHNACAFDEDGVTLTVWGDPALSFEAGLSVHDGQQVEPYTASARGALRWEASDGRSGRCEIDVVTITDFAARTSLTEGTVCDHEVRRTTSWS